MARIWARIESKEVGWKSTRSFRSVIKRVLEGGEGCDSGGRLERSIESEGRDDEREERLLWNEKDAGSERGGDVG